MEDNKDFSHFAWWRHQMETVSTLLALCVENLPITSEFPSQRPVTRSFDGLFDMPWTKGLVNNRNAGDLRRHRADNDDNAMCKGIMVSLDR